MQNFIGFDDQALLYNRQYTLSDRCPDRVVVRDAMLIGMRPTIEGNFLEELAGGAFTPSGALIEAALQPRSDGRNAVLPQQQIDLPVPGARLTRAVFGGVAFDHFGHFLLETTSRLWALPELAHLPWVFLTDGRPKLKDYQQGFLELLGLTAASIVPLADTCLVDELILPLPSFVYHHHVTHAYRDTFRRARPPAQHRPGRRIFLSRSQTTIALTVGERELEEVLARDGWEVVVPERLPPAAQADLFRHDNIVLGLQGSAMHLGLFAPPGRQVVHLCRGQAYRGYYVLDDLMQAQATYFQAMASPRLASKPITGPFLLDLDATIGFLRREGLLSPAGIGLPASVDHAELERDYEAWWHYTESQIRYHRQIDHDGNSVASESGLEPALAAARIRPDNSEILSHAVALTLKLQGAEAAAELLATGTRQPLGDSLSDAPLLHFHSIVEDMRGNHAAALDAAQRARSIEPSSAVYANQAATMLFRLGRAVEAEAVLDSLVATGRATGATHYLLSILREQRGDPEQALAAARQAVELDRHDEELCRRLVELLRRTGEDDAAPLAIADFLARNAGSARLRLEAAASERAAGRLATAVEHLRRALRSAPDDPEVRTHLLEALREQGMLPELKALGRLPSAAVREQSVMVYRRSLALAESGPIMEALKVAVVATGMYPDNETIMQNLLGLMLRAERPLDARLLINELVAHGRETGPYLYVLSLVEAELGSPGSARQAARRAAELSPENDIIVEHYRRFPTAGDGP